MSKEIEHSISSVDGEVSHCVSHLMRAFTDSLNIFKQVRKHRRRRQNRKNEARQIKDQSPTSAELQLSSSLRKGPVDIKETFENHYAKAGDRFAKGDAIAHASLTQTLLKLNAGLVGIISTFLSHGSKTDHLHLDYKSLTNLSNASRAEALNSLNHLYQRIGNSQLQIYHIGACRQCGSLKHQTCTASTTSSSNSSSSDVTSKIKTSSEKKRPSNARLRSTGPIIARMPVKSSSQPQLVMLRSKSPKKLPSSNASSTPSRAHTSPVTSPKLHPRSISPQQLQATPKDKTPSTSKSNKSTSNTGRKRTDSFDGSRPTTWPRSKPGLISPYQPSRIPSYEIPPLSMAPPPPYPTSKQPQSPTLKSPPPIPTPISPRRRDKATPSTYTFASDSTKLGEIPQRNWTTPWDYEEAERLNRDAAAGLQAMSGDEAKGKSSKQKKGLFKFLRRGSKA